MNILLWCCIKILTEGSNVSLFTKPLSIPEQKIDALHRTRPMKVTELKHNGNTKMEV
jgi:hypothetical protein